MKLTQVTIVLSTLLMTAAAQGLDSLPNCAKSCATNAIPAKCGIDVKCICSTQSFLSDISCCVANKCSEADQETTLKAAKSICASGGVTDLPDSVTCSTGTASGKTATDTTLSGSATATQNESMTTTTGESTAKTSNTATDSTDSSQTASSASTASSAATTTGGAAIGQSKDASLMAAAGAAALFAFFV